MKDNDKTILMLDEFIPDYTLTEEQSQQFKEYCNIEFNDVIKLMNKKPNYFQDLDKRFIYFDENLELCLIQNSENKEFITFIRRKNLKNEWRKL